MADDMTLNLSEEALAQPPQPREPLGDLGAAEPPAKSMLSDMISRKRKELAEIDKRLETHRETGVYTRTLNNGEQVFDSVAFHEDTAKAARLNREINELRDQDRERERQGDERSKMAANIARELARAEAPMLPEEYRQPVLKAFTELFNRIVSGGEFRKVMYADRSAVEALINQAWENAVGNAVRSVRRGTQPGGQPPASGLDASDMPQEKKPPERNEDGFTNNLMYAYERRNKTSKTFAEARRERQDAERRRLEQE